MKKFSKITALLAASALLFGGLFLSCSDDDDDDDPVLTSIVAGGSATIEKGAKFPSDNLHVYAYYDNATGTYSEPGASAKDVTNDATFTIGSTSFKVGDEVNLDAGTYTLTVTYKDKTVTAAVTLVVNEAGYKITGGDWWTVFAGDDVKVESRKQVVTNFKVTKIGSTNWECAPNVILRDSAATTANNVKLGAAEGSKEYAAVRADNYGWCGANNTGDKTTENPYGGNVMNWILDSDWDWSTFQTYINGSTVKITVKNYGTGKADVLYDFEKDGTKHHQYFKDIAVTADDLYVNLIFQNCDALFESNTIFTASDISSSSGSEDKKDDTKAVTYDFTKVAEADVDSILDSSTPRKVAAGTKTEVAGATIYSKGAGNLRMRINEKTVTAINYNGADADSIANGANIDSLSRWISIPVTGAGTVSASIKAVNSSSNTGTLQMGLFDADGKLLGKLVTADVATGNITDTEASTATLSGTVSAAGTVYVILSRNGANGGGMDVYNITFTPAN